MPNLNDSLDDLFGGLIGEVRTVPVQAPATFIPKLYTEPCSKCRGTGFWRGRGRCFACKGAGAFTYKTSPEARAKARVDHKYRLHQLNKIASELEEIAIKIQEQGR